MAVAIVFAAVVATAIGTDAPISDDTCDEGDVFCDMDGADLVEAEEAKVMLMQRRVDEEHGVRRLVAERQVRADMPALQNQSVDDETKCYDTRSWTNSYTRCEDENFGHPPYCILGKGWTCAGYVKRGWCAKGGTGPEYFDGAFGHLVNYPEYNCCACGKGLCEDTLDWTNGYAACDTEQDGVPPYCLKGAGWTCAGYAKRGWCSNGGTGPIYFEGAFGKDRNHPEYNCCACGKGHNRCDEHAVDRRRMFGSLCSCRRRNYISDDGKQVCVDTTVLMN